MTAFMELTGVYFLEKKINRWWQKEKWFSMYSQTRPMYIDFNEVEFLCVAVSRDECLCITEIGLKSGKTARVKEGIHEINRRLTVKQMKV